MVRKILKDIFIFKKAELAMQSDLQVAIDLTETLQANSEICAGMAANMIGENKRIIAFFVGEVIVTMINPIITWKSKETYEADESCLSLTNSHLAVRHEMIEVEYVDMSFRKLKHKYSGFVAQVIQHEIDHCEGIVV